MKTLVLSRRRLLVGLALGTTLPFGGCNDSGAASGKPAEIKQEQNKKSMEASGDFYKQQHQKKKK